MARGRAFLCTDRMAAESPVHSHLGVPEGGSPVCQFPVRTSATRVRERMWRTGSLESREHSGTSAWPRDHRPSPPFFSLKGRHILNCC